MDELGVDAEDVVQQRRHLGRRVVSGAQLLRGPGDECLDRRHIFEAGQP